MSAENSNTNLNLSHLLSNSSFIKFGANLNSSEDIKIDPYLIPPNLDIAEKYADHMHIGKLIQGRKIFKTDPESIKKKPASIFTSLNDFNIIGSEYSLFFRYSILVGFNLFLMAGIVGIYNLKYAYENPIYPSFINGSTLLNLCRVSNIDGLSPYLNLAYVIAASIAVIVFRGIQLGYRREFEQENILASHFTLLVRGLPREDSATDVKDFFIKEGGLFTQLRVKKVILTYYISEYVKFERTRFALELKKRNNPSDQDVDRELSAINENLEKIEKLQIENIYDNPTGIGLVIFESNLDALSCERKWKIGLIKKFYYILKLKCGCKVKKTYKGRILKVERAPEPSDLFWENIEYISKYHLSGLLKTLISGILFIGISVGSTYGLYYLENKLESNTVTNTDVDITYIIPISVGAIICIINQAISFLFRRIALNEKFASTSKFHKNLVWRISIAQILNTVGVNYGVIYFNYPNLTVLLMQEKLFLHIFWLIIINGFLTPCFILFDIANFNKKRKIEKIFQLKEKCLLTQMEANKIFLGTQFELSQKYANVQRVLYLVSFYGGHIPIGIFAGLGSMIILYWVDKWVFLRRHSKPPVMHCELAIKMIETLEISILLFAFGNFIFEYNLSKTLNIYLIIALIFAGAVWVLPTKIIMNIIWRRNFVKIPEKILSNCPIDLTEEYDDTNPVPPNDFTLEEKTSPQKVKRSVIRQLSAYAHNRREFNKAIPIKSELIAVLSHQQANEDHSVLGHLMLNNSTLINDPNSSQMDIAAVLKNSDVKLDTQI